jgi:ribosome-associated protein
MIEINPTLSIPRHELRFEATTSSGPGGQHVNRSRTRITLLFDVEMSTALSPDQKRRVWTKLATRIDRVGRVRVRCGRHRSQAMNREETIRRFAALIRDALRYERRRVATRPSTPQRKRRLKDKRKRSEIKRRRRTPSADDD